MPTELGFTVSDQLSEHFQALMDVSFTANMENLLDAVAAGKEDWVKLLNDFGGDFYPTLDKARTEMARSQQETNIKCENCGKPMAIKFGKTGEFLGCTGFPTCRTIKNFTRDEQGNIQIVEREKPEETGVKCEKCGRPMAIKQSRRGEFLGCTGYPDCKSIVNFKRDENGKIQVVESEKPEVSAPARTAAANCCSRRRAPAPGSSPAPTTQTAHMPSLSPRVCPVRSKAAKANWWRNPHAGASCSTPAPRIPSAIMRSGTGPSTSLAPNATIPS